MRNWVADEVDVGDLLGHRVLHLDARVHLDEHVLSRTLALGVEQELDGSRVDIADALGKGDGVPAHRLPDGGIEVGRGRDLDDLLVASLERAVALVEVDDVAGRIGDDLHLDMAGPNDGLLEEHCRRRRMLPRPRAWPP